MDKTFAYPFGTGIFANPGLTKRELFAAMAMQAIISKTQLEATHDSITPHTEGTALGAVDYADALIAAL